MITLRRLITLLVLMHIAMAFVTLVHTYFNGYFTNYGMDGWLASTPIGSHFDLESTDMGAEDVSLSDVPGFFRFFFDLGDTVNSLASIDYAVLSEISSVNFLYVLVLGLRLFSVIVWFTVAAALIKGVLESNLLGSKVGLVVLFGSIGILSGLGIFF